MNQIVTPTTQILLQAAAIKVAELDAGHLALFKNDITPTKGMLLAALTEADFSGYVRKAIATWDAPFVDADGSVVSLAGLSVFTCSGAGTNNQIFGAYYLDTGGALVWAGRFGEAPINMALATDALPFVARYVFDTLPLS